MGQVTDRDVEMVSLLIGEPGLSLDEVGRRLGISKQAVAERKNRLEEEGFTRSHYFWNVTPRFECTKRVRIKIEKGSTKIGAVLDVLDRFNPVVVFCRDDPEEFFNGKASSITQTIDEVEGILLFNNGDEEKHLKSILLDRGMAEVTIEPVLFSRLLGEKCDITPKTPNQVEVIALEIAKMLSSEASVQAVLYESHEQPMDQFDLLVIRDERFQPETDSYERRVKQTLVDYHFANPEWFMQSKNTWIKNMKIAYARDESVRRKIQRKINRLRTDADILTT